MRRGHLPRLLRQHIQRGDLLLRRGQLFVELAALGDVIDDVLADAQPVGAVEFLLRLVLRGLRRIDGLLRGGQRLVRLARRQAAARKRHARQLGGDLELRLRGHAVVLAFRQRVVGLHPDFLGALEPNVAVFALQLHQLLLRRVVFAAQTFHLLVVAGDLRLKEHVARRNPAPLRHAHPLDGHALVGSQRQLHILRLREREIAAELDFLLQLALLGGHQLDLGG